MRNLLRTIAVLGIAVFGTALATAQKTTTSAEAEVRAAVASWHSTAQANDPAAMRKLISDDFIGTTFSGTVVDKDDVAPEGEEAGTFPENTIEDLRVHVYGDTAVAIGAMVFKPGTLGTLRFTQVWAKRDGAWQMVAAHLSRAQ